MKPIVAWMLLLVLAVALVPAWAEEEAAITPYAYWATETLPRIYIETENGMALDDPSLVIPDEHKGMAGEIAVYDYVNATITVTDCEGYELDAVAGQVKIRGNYTSNYPKKPIRIKFSEKQAMAGLNEGNAMKSWVLLAEYKDPALLRNSVALYVANSLYSTTGNYASDFRNVEVYLNGEYNGLYVLAEQQQVDKNRVNVAEARNPKKVDQDALTEEEIAALKDGHIGYFLEYDGYYTNEDPAETFTIRYDEVTRPDGETFLPASAGNDPESAEGGSYGGFGGWNGAMTAPAGENDQNQNAWGSNGGTATAPAEDDNQTANPWGSNGGTAGESDRNQNAWGSNGGTATAPAEDDNQNANPWGSNRGTWGNQAGGNFGGGFSMNRQTGFTIQSDLYFEEQRDFIQHTLQTVWDVLYDAVYADHSDLAAHPYHTMDADGNCVAAPELATAYDAVASVVDVDSLIDMYIIQELCQDNDLSWSSFFFSIDMSAEGNHLLTYTAPWDFDSGFTYMSQPTDLYAMNTDNPWLVLFYGQDWFWQLVRDRWDAAAAAGVFTGVLDMVDTLTAVNQEEYDRNLERWTSSGSEFSGLGGNQNRSFGGSSGGQSQSQATAAASLRAWLETKIASMDRVIHQMAGD